ncbi:hypothetical protein E2C01_077668 [Portunus trituberculatus]|uniref:Uncharacterized protein n=1 Tax=Portunus trituberculatus TaxID=210409 RepID=A0A5B7ILX6_PORTR|nr:hypothetical protein [Portunus trituberculatus]
MAGKKRLCYRSVLWRGGVADAGAGRGCGCMCAARTSQDLPIHQEGCLTSYYYFFVALHFTTGIHFPSPWPSSLPVPAFPFGTLSRDWAADEPWVLAHWLSLALVIGRNAQSIGATTLNYVTFLGRWD